MKIILKDTNQYVLTFERGEEVMGKLKEFCMKEGIEGGFLSGLGACGYLRLAYYNLEEKSYIEKEFSDDMEIASLTGNIAVVGEETVVHIHGVFSGRELSPVAGHVMEMKIAVTCEVHITKFPHQLKRELDSNIGLRLLCEL